MTAFLLTWKETGWPHENIVRMVATLDEQGHVDEPWRIASCSPAGGPHSMNCVRRQGHRGPGQPHGWRANDRIRRIACNDRASGDRRVVFEKYQRVILRGDINFICLKETAQPYRVVPAPAKLLNGKWPRALMP
jgi:hypothetical protein